MDSQNKMDTYMKRKEIAETYFFKNQEIALEKLTDIIRNHTTNKNVIEDFKNCVSYNSFGGKYFRGISMLQIYLNLSHDEIYINTVAIIAWCIEYIHALFLILDDVMDRSKTRRNKPCWYKLDNVNLSAINDAFLMKSAVIKLIKQEIKGIEKDKFIDFILNIFIDTSIGQDLDYKLCMMGSKTLSDFSIFNFDSYDDLVRYKTSYYTFYLPYMAAYFFNEYYSKRSFKIDDINGHSKTNDEKSFKSMKLTYRSKENDSESIFDKECSPDRKCCCYGKFFPESNSYKSGKSVISSNNGANVENISDFPDSESIQETKECLMIIGKLFQIQDDYLDIYGDPEVTGKYGTDIQEGKCSWFVAKILQIISPEDLKIMKESYGRLEESHVKIIIDLYEKYKLLDKYNEEIKELSKQALYKLGNIKNKDMADYYSLFIDKLIGRKK